MDHDSPFAALGPAPEARHGSGTRTVCIVFCADCLAHWTAPTKGERCVKCRSMRIELLKVYQTRAARV